MSRRRDPNRNLVTACVYRCHSFIIGLIYVRMSTSVRLGGACVMTKGPYLFFFVLNKWSVAIYIHKSLTTALVYSRSNRLQCRCFTTHCEFHFNLKIIILSPQHVSAFLLPSSGVRSWKPSVALALAAACWCYRNCCIELVLSYSSSCILLYEIHSEL